MNNFTSLASNSTLNSKNDNYSTILMKNCGLDPQIFNNMQKYIYVYKKDPLKKVCSSNAIVALPINDDDLFKNNKKRPYEVEDKETYERQEISKILDNGIYCINTKNQNQLDIKNNNNNNKRNSAFEENPQLDYLIQSINNDFTNSHSLINSYNSKSNSKFMKVYSINSINIQGKIKYKLFHKCCFPGCERTFSSAGWLKAHFKDHLKQIKNSNFSVLFKKYIYKGDILKNMENFKINKEKNLNSNNKKKAIFIVDK